MSPNYSKPAYAAIRLAKMLASQLGSDTLTSAHLFLAVLEESRTESVVFDLLGLAGVTADEAKIYAQSFLEVESERDNELKISDCYRRVLGFAATEAHQNASLIEPEHLFIACIQYQKGPHVGEVLRPLGLDAAQLNAHLRGIQKSQKPYAAGHPLNELSTTGKEAIESAQEMMRLTFCGQISTAHLMLGCIASEKSEAVRTLLNAGVDLDDLRDHVRAQIVSDGQIATPQKKFTPLGKRTLERAQTEARLCELPLIGPHHLFYGLLPGPVSVWEKIGFGDIQHDPLEKVWPHLPVPKIKEEYAKLWQQQVAPGEASLLLQQQPEPRTTFDSGWTFAGFFWWSWVLLGTYGVIMVFGGYIAALLIDLWAESKPKHVLRYRAGNFCSGLLCGIPLGIVYGLTAFVR